MAKLYEYLTSFKVALLLAILGVVNVGMSAYTGSITLWFDVIFVLFWVYIARKAVNRELGPDEFEVTLTQDQKDRVKAASDNLHTVIDEVEGECMAEVTAMRLKAKEKARVQSDKREDQEAGSEGDD